MSRKLLRSEIIAGTILTLSLIILSFLFVTFFLKALTYYSLILATLVEIFLLYSCLSTKELAVESRWVEDALQSKDILLARKKLSLIVGRDTDQLNEKEIIRGTVETIAENTVDGIIAPIFYAIVGGAPLAIAYKTINTLDSMIGHRDAQYIRFGKVAAFIDTWVNWIPARIAGFFLPVAAASCGYSFKNSFSVAWKEGAKNYVPNSGIPEGAMAGALRIQLGGTNFYKGQEVQAPTIGNPIRSLTIQNIHEAITVMHVSSLLFFLFGLGIKFLFDR